MPKCIAFNQIKKQRHSVLYSKTLVLSPTGGKVNMTAWPWVSDSVTSWKGLILYSSFVFYLSQCCQSLKLYASSLQIWKITEKYLPYQRELAPKTLTYSSIWNVVLRFIIQVHVVILIQLKHHLHKFSEDWTSNKVGIAMKAKLLWHRLGELKMVWMLGHMNLI